jgi:type IV secretory pathway VirB2 component (pilin)
MTARDRGFGVVATWRLPERKRRRPGGGWRVLPRWRKALAVAGAALLLLAAASAGAGAADVLGISQPLTVLLQSLMIAAVPLAGIGLIFLCVGWWAGNAALMMGGLGVAALGGMATKAQTAEQLMFGAAAGAEVRQTDAWVADANRRVAAHPAGRR